MAVATRAARPGAGIGVDSNQGYDRPTLAGLLPALVEHGVAQLEQPLGRGREADLDGLKRPLPFVADESALSLVDTASLVGRFDIVNIKLDKCGGLRSEEHTSELTSLMRISYAVFCLKNKNN